MTLLNFSFYMFCCFVITLLLAGLPMLVGIVCARFNWTFASRHAGTTAKASSALLLVALFFLLCSLFCALFFNIYSVAHAI